MPAERSSSKGDIFLGPTAYPGTPKGLLDAISEIQQYYVVERSGSTISDDFLTFKGKLSFFEVGFKVASVSALISILLTPVAIGVVQKYIPIFGSYEPSLFDKAFAMLLALSFSSGYGLLMAVLGKYYIGSISRAAIRNLFGGLIVGSVFKVAAAFILFHFMYFIMLEPARLAGLLMKLRPVLKPAAMDSLFHWLIDFKPVLLTSAYFIAFSAFIMVAIPIGSILIVSRRARKVMDREQAWS